VIASRFPSRKRLTQPGWAHNIQRCLRLDNNNHRFWTVAAALQAQRMLRYRDAGLCVHSIWLNGRNRPSPALPRRQVKGSDANPVIRNIAHQRVASATPLHRLAG
jgi:hypothetical protein